MNASTYCIFNTTLLPFADSAPLNMDFGLTIVQPDLGLAFTMNTNTG